MRRGVRALAAGIALLACAQASSAQTVYKIVVPFAPGGGQDVLARVIAPELSRITGNSYIIENRPGAGGGVGSAVVSKSKPDGSTLLMAASSHNIGAAINRNTPYDPIKDFTAVAHVGTGAYVVLTSAKVPAKTISEFVAYAKANAGKLNYSSAGVGSATHLAMAYFAGRAEIDIVHVPFKSTAEALNSIASGDTQILIVPTLGSQGFIANPSIRALAVVSKARLASLADVPTVDESGLKGHEFTSWFGLLGPAKMPPEIVTKINSAVAEILSMPQIAEKIDQQGVTPRAMSSEAFEKLLIENFDDIKRIAKSASISVD